MLILVSKVFEPKQKDGYMKWTKREVNWYLAENRMLFASFDEMEICKWNIVFQWILSRREETN